MSLLFLVSVWTLFLVGQVRVQGWDWIDDSQLHSLYETGHWSEPVDVRAPHGEPGQHVAPDPHFTPAAGPHVEPSEPRGPHVEPSDPRGPHVEPSDPRGPHVEPSDLHGPHVEPSEPHGPHAAPMVSPDERSDYDEAGSALFEPLGLLVEGPAFVPSGPDHPAHSEFRSAAVDDDSPQTWTSHVSGQSSADVDVVCSSSGFEITLFTGLMRDVKVLGSKDLVSVEDASGSCGFHVDHHTNSLTVPFTGCYVKTLVDGFSLQLLHLDSLGHAHVSTVACERRTGSESLDPRALPEKCKGPTTPPPTTTKFIPTTTMITTRAPTTAAKAKGCSIPAGERLPCGKPGISSSDCKELGCCMDPSKSTCYYALDECTADQHFIFAIRYDSAPINVDPTKLIMPKSPSCKPVIVNDKVAIFKFKVTECGTLSHEVGEMKVYLAEVQTIIQALNLKFGVITRSDPVRFMVECRYSKSGNKQVSLASVGYMVKTPASTLPSVVISNGVYSIKLRMATDDTFTHYYPAAFQPLRLLLGSPIYLELHLDSPAADAVILVHYCLAYPKSASNALVLVYEGCANPNDPHVSVLKPVIPPGSSPKNMARSRFKVLAFQFMSRKTNKYLDEEIYFMCSAEVCRPAERSCEQQC